MPIGRLVSAANVPWGVRSGRWCTFTWWARVSVVSSRSPSTQQLLARRKPGMVPISVPAGIWKTSTRPAADFAVTNRRLFAGSSGFGQKHGSSWLVVTPSSCNDSGATSGGAATAADASTPRHTSAARTAHPDQRGTLLDVPEGTQPLRFRWLQVDRLGDQRGARLGLVGVEQPAQVRGDVVVLDEHVVLLAGIAGDVEQPVGGLVRLARLDELPAVRGDAADHGTQVFLAHQVGEERRRIAEADGLERTALAGRTPLAEGAENGRHDVDAADRFAHDRAGALARVLDDQRDVDQRLEGGVRVAPQAVVEELLAVVGGDHDHRLVVQSRPAQGGEQAAELGVGVGDRAVIERD